MRSQIYFFSHYRNKNFLILCCGISCLSSELYPHHWMVLFLPPFSSYLSFCKLFQYDDWSICRAIKTLCKKWCSGPDTKLHLVKKHQSWSTLNIWRKAWQHSLKNAASNIEPIKIRQTRHAGHCWRSKDELISDILLWTPSHGWVKAGWPARTYIQQLCANIGYSLEDLPGAMDDRDGWWERVREICTGSMTWW